MNIQDYIWRLADWAQEHGHADLLEACEAFKATAEWKNFDLAERLAKQKNAPIAV